MLNIKWGTNGKSLAFGGRGTYNPANREIGSGAFVFEQVPLGPRALSGSPAFQSRIRTQSGPDVDAVAAKLDKNKFPGKAIS
jgi:hypothetical protein